MKRNKRSRKNRGLKIVTYEELLTVRIYENEEKLIPLNEHVACAYKWFDMLPITGDQMFVRESVAKRIISADKELKRQYPDWRLKVFYGYRHPKVQEKYFLAMKDLLKGQYKGVTGKELDGIVHSRIAVPRVAGHPTGGAVDVTITTIGGEIEMGVGVEDLSDSSKLETFSKKVSSVAQKNRLILRDIMTKQGFAPFDGEWWHFSYGDREWAYFYSKPNTLYAPIDFKTL